jgi:hypothetical protein
MRATFVIILAVAALTSLGAEPAAKPATAPASINTFAFLESYRIAHYLESAAALQKLDPDKRAARLRELAEDPARASEVFPLCRMLFEAKSKAAFRRPGIGAPLFIGGTEDLADWPLEPITIVDGVPILVVRGYMLAGFAEPPKWYVEYCLSDCKWRDVRYAPIDAAQLKGIVEKFIAARPKLITGDVVWLREQAE